MLGNEGFFSNRPRKKCTTINIERKGKQTKNNPIGFIKKLKPTQKALPTRDVSAVRMQQQKFEVRTHRNAPCSHSWARNANFPALSELPFEQEPQLENLLGKIKNK